MATKFDDVRNTLMDDVRVLFEGLQAEARYLKVAFTADHKVYMDAPVVNP